MWRDEKQLTVLGFFFHSQNIRVTWIPIDLSDFNRLHRTEPDHGRVNTFKRHLSTERCFDVLGVNKQRISRVVNNFTALSEASVWFYGEIRTNLRNDLHDIVSKWTPMNYVHAKIPVVLGFLHREWRGNCRWYFRIATRCELDKAAPVWENPLCIQGTFSFSPNSTFHGGYMF